MKFSVEIAPSTQAVQLIDEMMKSYVTIYELPNARELCFVLHELVINAVEAMLQVELAKSTIQVQVKLKEDELQMTVIDQAGGIPEEQWQEALTYDFETMSDSDRGRGLFFVQHMVDRIWFELDKPNQFLVKVSKKIMVAVEV